MLMSHARNGDEFWTPRHRGSPEKFEVLAFVILVNPKPVWNSWTLACYHGMASTCWGKKYCPIWGRLWYKLLANQSFSHNKPDGFSRVRATLGDETIYVASSYFQKFPHVNIEQQECCVKFRNFSLFVWTFLCINWVFDAFMCIIHIWTTCTCSSAYKLVEKSNMCPWVHA